MKMNGSQISNEMEFMEGGFGFLVYMKLLASILCIFRMMERHRLQTDMARRVGPLVRASKHFNLLNE
jgi:hypothetical protein